MHWLKQNWFKLCILMTIIVGIVVICLSAGIYFENQLTIAYQGFQKQCFTDGSKLLEDYKNQYGTKDIFDTEFHYNQKLGKCYTSATLMPYRDCDFGAVIFDVYEGKIVLSDCETSQAKPTYGDFSVYPSTILTYVQYLTRRNAFMEYIKQ